MARLDLPRMPLLVNALEQGWLTLPEAWEIEAHEVAARMLQLPQTPLPASLHPALTRLMLLQERRQVKPS